MSENIFLKKGPFELKRLFKGNNSFDQNLLIQDFKILQNANKKDLTFLTPLGIKNMPYPQKSFCCITTEGLKQYLPNSCVKIIVKNVLFETAKILSNFTPLADLDYLDKNLKVSNHLSIPR